MDYLGETVALGIDAIVFGLCARLYFKNRTALTAVKNAPVLEVSTNLEDFVKNQPQNEIPFVAVRGLVKSIGAPIRSLNALNVTGVVQKLSIKEHVIARGSAGFWSEQERTVQEVYNTVPFVLESTVGSSQVEVVDALAANIFDLETIVDRYEPTSLGLFDQLWGFFSGMRQRGLQHTEEMLREGTILTGIGQLSVGGGTINGLKLMPPTDGLPFYLTTLPISSLVRTLDDQRRTYRILTIIFGSIGVFIIFMLAKRMWQDYKKTKYETERKQQLERTRKERRTRVREMNLPEIQLCVVCKLNPREMILLPCGHVCICEDCNENITELCPVCRAQIETRAPAYIT